jgi:hypothetical protein
MCRFHTGWLTEELTCCAGAGQKHRQPTNHNPTNEYNLILHRSGWQDQFQINISHNKRLA